MGSEKKNSTPSSAIALKSGLWYTVCNFLFRAMAFISTPVFARLLTKADMGLFSNYSSWITVLTAVTAMDLHSSIIRSKLEFEDDMDSYIYSILSLSTPITVSLYIIVLCFSDFFVSFFGVEMKYIHLMFFYLAATPAYQMLITKHRAYYKYKSFVGLTGVTIVSSTMISLIMVLVMEDKFAGRAFGFYIPYIIIGVSIYILLARRGRKIKFKYWKYACVICIPLVPHLLSFYVLDTSDKIIITRLSGAEYTAIYSIAYSCFRIVNILMDSMNKAWAPWLLDNLHAENYKEIKDVSKKYITIFVMLVVMILIFVPELIFILGGKKYMMAKYCLPPLIISCVLQLIYTMYVNVEFYMKKTVGVAFATTIAAVINIILNIVCISMNPEYGYIIASYTTLVGYFALLVLHYMLVRRMKMAFVFDLKFIIGSLFVIVVLSSLMNLLYGVYLIRYVIALCYMAVVGFILLKNKDQILSMLKKK